jgi:hydrogenase nickel incorporation protein HypA/HybF
MRYAGVGSPGARGRWRAAHLTSGERSVEAKLPTRRSSLVTRHTAPESPPVHELSIARDLIDLAVEEAARAGASRVVRVKLRLGALAGVAPPALRTAFHAARAGTPAADAALEIEHIAAAVHCARCTSEQTLTTPQCRRCPVCGMPATALTAGEELELAEIEIE